MVGSASLPCDRHRRSPEIGDLPGASAGGLALPGMQATIGVTKKRPAAPRLAAPTLGDDGAWSSRGAPGHDPACLGARVRRGPRVGRPARRAFLGRIPVDFILFGATLAGVALFHRFTLQIAVGGLATITAYKLAFTGFPEGPGVLGLIGHLGHEWVILANLFCLLMGFALLSRHFEKSRMPLELPRFLPDDWKGGFLLLVMIFVLSSFLDNIAAALIGGAMAHQLFKARVHIGYLGAIVAAANAGGSGSVVGDTTTTMMWTASRRRCSSRNTRPSSSTRTSTSASTGRASSSWR
jgi:hypothetical protein